MPDNNQDKLVQAVLDAFAGTPEPRLRELMTALDAARAGVCAARST